MGFIASGIRDAFEAQGELGFMVWAYASSDPLRAVLEPDYFLGMCRRFRVGDLVYVGVTPRPSGSPWKAGAGEVRRALLMVSAVDPGGAVRVRLVQDFGAPEDPDAPQTAAEVAR